MVFISSKRMRGRIANKKRVEKLLPFLQILGELHPVKRQLLIEHMDEDSCEGLRLCIDTVLEEGEVNSNMLTSEMRDKIKSCLRSNRPQFKHIMSSSKKSNKRRALAQIGGGPLALILSAAIPMLVNMIMKKRK